MPTTARQYSTKADGIFKSPDGSRKQRIDTRAPHLDVRVARDVMTQSHNDKYATVPKQSTLSKQSQPPSIADRCRTPINDANIPW